MSSLVFSVLLSLVSAVAYAAGAIVQERVAAAGDSRPYAPLRNGAWWVAVALNGVGALLHVVALAYGPLSLVQPLGALTIVFALPMAAVFVRRRAGRTAWRGAVMATVGLAGLLALTGNAGSHTLAGPEQLMLATGTFGAVVALLVVAKGLHRPMLHSVVLATGAGVAFGMASVFTKTVAVEWTSGAVKSGLPTLLVIAALAAAGLLLSQAAYRGAGLAAPLATVTVVNPVVAAAVGLTMFGEQFRYGMTGTLLAIGCGALAAAGLVLLTTERVGAEQREPESSGASAAGRSAPEDPADDAPEEVDADGDTDGAVVLPEPAKPGAPPRATLPGRFPAPTALSLPLTLPPDHGSGRVEFGDSPSVSGPARRGDLGPAGTVRTLTPSALRQAGGQTLTPPALR
ncbi:DMT family transporter [Streptomyces sp. NPDC006516]|uniref:DMT family transporter n=1 Tax=Streptomyces sp. NPDC006516 TaxID=3154309 RepID=UPI0033B37A62